MSKPLELFSDLHHVGGKFYVRFKLRLDKTGEPLALEGVWQPDVPTQTEMKKQIVLSKYPNARHQFLSEVSSRMRMNMLCLDVGVPL